MRPIARATHHRTNGGAGPDLECLQQAAMDRLAGWRELRGIPVLACRGDGPTLPLREALRAGRGLCIVVLRARIDGGDGVLRVRVVENAFAAHPRHDALSLAEVVSRALHGWNPSLPGFETPFSIDGEDAWDIPEEPDARGRYRVGMRFTARASADLPRPATAAS